MEVQWRCNGGAMEMQRCKGGANQPELGEIDPADILVQCR